MTDSVHGYRSLPPPSGGNGNNGLKSEAQSRSSSDSSPTENDHYYPTKSESTQDSPTGGMFNNPQDYKSPQDYSSSISGNKRPKQQDSPPDHHHHSGGILPVKKGRGRPKKICDGVELKEWSDEEIYKLIGLWGSYDILYNCKHPLYHNKSEKAKAMERLRENLEEAGIPATTRQIFDKLTTLRNYYGAVKRKSESLKRQGFEGEEAYFCRWQFYQPLAFLDGTFSPRHSDLHMKKHPYMMDNSPMSSSVRTMSTLLTLTNQQQQQGGRPSAVSAVGGGGPVRDPYDPRPIEAIQASHMMRSSQSMHNPIMHLNHTHPPIVNQPLQPHNHAVIDSNHPITDHAVQSNHSNEPNNNSNSSNSESLHNSHVNNNNLNHVNGRSTPINQSNHPYPPNHPAHPANHIPHSAKLPDLTPNHLTAAGQQARQSGGTLPNHHANHTKHNPHSDKTEDQLFGEIVAKMIAGIVDSEEKALLLIRIQQDIVQTKFRAKSAFQKPRTQSPTPWNTGNQDSNASTQQQARDTNSNHEYYTEPKGANTNEYYAEQKGANTTEYFTEQKAYHSNSSVQHSSLEHSPLSSRSDSPLSSPAGAAPKLDMTT